MGSELGRLCSIAAGQARVDVRVRLGLPAWICLTFRMFPKKLSSDVVVGVDANAMDP